MALPILSQATPIDIVAQYTMDEYYLNYKSETDFFTLKDFIFHCGATVTGAFQQGFDAMRTELRSEKQDEVVGFSHNWLSLTEVLQVKRQNNQVFVEMEQPVMSFLTDTQDAGYQDIIPVAPTDVELERSNISQFWQFKLLPATNRIFWYVLGNKIYFFNKGDCHIQQLQVLYVPGISDTMLIPGGLVNYAMSTTLAVMKQLGEGTVIKKSLDQNQNKIINTEVDKLQLK